MKSQHNIFIKGALCIVVLFSILALPFLKVENYRYDFKDGVYDHLNYINREVVTTFGNGTLLFYYTERYITTPNGKVKAELTDLSISCK